MDTEEPVSTTKCTVVPGEAGVLTVILQCSFCGASAEFTKYSTLTSCTCTSCTSLNGAERHTRAKCPFLLHNLQ